MIPKNTTQKSFLLWIIIFIVVFFTARLLQGPMGEAQKKEISFSQFVKEVQNKEVLNVSIDQQEVSGVLKSGIKFVSYIPSDAGIIPLLQKEEVPITVVPQVKEGGFIGALISWLPIILFLGIWLVMMRQMSSTNGKALSFGKSKARLLAEKGKITFKDVAGIEEAKQELEEVVEFLKTPTKFQKLGGKVPKGVLLVGPPGTGKTLLARAIAGEAEVPFFTISGSDFVEMFVGVGASRVRDMFEQAKKAAPCIVFVDEIDAVGRHRGAGLGGGNDEREQTLNQLLVEMDGFEPNSGIILIAATNRPDVLDPALLRPGRFDRQIVVSNPDVKGREAILQVHVRKIPLGHDVKLNVLARGTPGFSGADLANLINEGALLAARRNKIKVTMRDLEDAKDKVMMGTERRSFVMDENEKKMTAYHEAGHAILSLLLPETDPIHKVTIIPRGRALGVTMQLPEKDKYSQSKTYLLSRIAILFGGRIAEELVLGPENVSTGASNDIQVATTIARKMVSEWGMSKLGPIAYEEPKEEVFLGYDISKRKYIADETALLVDKEIQLIIGNAYKNAQTLLKKNRKQLDLLAKGLIEYETLSGEEIKMIIAEKKMKNFQEKKEFLARKTVPSVLKKINSQKNKQSGRSMLEMLGVICIVGILIVSAFSGIEYAMMMMRVNKAHADIEEIATSTVDLYSWSKTYDNLSMVELCANNILDEKCLGTLNANGKCESGCYWVGAWGGEITVDKATTAVNAEEVYKNFRIIYTQIPKEACYKMLEEKWQNVELDLAEGVEPCSDNYNNQLNFKNSVKGVK